MRIACLIDSKGKVQHYRVNILRSLFPDHQFDPIVVGKRKLKKRAYDVIYYCSYSLFERYPLKHPAIRASVTSHKSIDAGKKTRKILRNMHKISVNNKYLYGHFKAKNVFYIPNGVDTALFYPGEKSYDPSLIKLGWVGNRDRATKNYGIIKKLSKTKDMKGFKLCVLATSKSKPIKKSKKQMADFYRSIDFLLVSSTTEGTPNPALEAASCGVPIIGTSVGNMPDLINDGKNGFIVDRPRFSFFKRTLIEKVHPLTSQEYNRMSQDIRSSILSGWDWKYRKDLYEQFLLKE